MAARDQYQHYLPRFILKPFVQDDLVHVYSLPINRVQRKCPKSAFGELNLYRTATGEDDVEELLRNLETDTSTLLSAFKKVAATGSLSNNNAVKLFQKDVDKIKKFLIVASLRTRMFRNHFIDVKEDTSVEEYILTETGKKCREAWLDMLRHLLQTSFDKLLCQEAVTRGINGKGDETGEEINNAVELCQMVSKMKLHIWKAPAGKEFLLGDPLVRIEGQFWAAGERRPQAAHLFMPISPTVLVLLCDETNCQTRSMLFGEAHKPPKSDMLAEKKKPASYGIYFVMECSPTHLSLLNGHILASTRVVFRSRSAFDEARNSISEFTALFDAQRGSSHSPDDNSNTGPKQQYDGLGGIGDVLLEATEDYLRSLRILEPAIASADIRDGCYWVAYSLLSLKQANHRFCPHCEEGLIGEFPMSILTRFEAAYAVILDNLVTGNF